jgi:predicted permease
MLDKLVVVGGQVLILALLLAVGFAFGRFRLIGQAGMSAITSLVLYAAVPCTLVDAFQVELTADTLHSFFIALAAGLGCHLFNFLVSWLLIREKNDQRKRVMVIGSTFTNCGFLGYPLMAALIGPMGIFYGSPYNLVFNTFFWTVGVVYLEKGQRFDLKKAFLNPAVAGIAAGLLVFFTGLRLPALAEGAVSYLAGLAIPLPMLMIGCQLAFSDLRGALRAPVHWRLAVLRLLVLPFLEVLALHLCGVQGDILVATAISAAAPPGSMVAMVAQRYDREAEFASEMVSIQTLLSIFTIPLLVSLAQTLA